MNAATNLTTRLLQELPQRLTEVQHHNVDYRRAGFWQSPNQQRLLRAKLAMRDVLLRGARKLRLVRWTETSVAEVTGRMNKIFPLMEDFERLYAELVDDRSRDVMVETLLYRLLGDKYVKLSRNDSRFWEQYSTIESHRTKVPAQRCGQINLPQFEYSGSSGPLRVHTHPLGALNTFSLEQYVCRRPGFDVSPHAGDTVIDGGGCWGDTTIWFADRVGEAGKVFVYEFVPDNLRVLEDNLRANPVVGSRVTIVRRPLWSVPNHPLQWQSNGPASNVGAGSETANTGTVDQLVEDESLSRVDFLKLDIEGAELEALRGAAKTIKAFKPRLALSVYHRDDDLKRIPQFFRGLGLSYRWALEHFTIHSEETMLFGLASEA